MSAQEVVALTAPAALAQVRLLVVGDVMLDRYWFGDVSRISPEAPVPIVRIEKREERLGGAANVARNAAALGAKTSLLGVVGDDEAGSQVERLLEGGGIHSYLQRDAAISTIIKLRVIGRQQQMVRIDFEDAPTEVVLRDKLTQYKALLADYDVIILDEVIYALGYLDFKLIELKDVIRLIKEKPPQMHLILTGRNAPPEIVELADLVTEMGEVKHPMKRGIPAQQGIDY